ncbi:MAG TPA: hypothetical protein VH107_04775 [Lacipirellulaceae bacterium]|nr:hypothetical protein [Lacipirellulaceae bacterium]
MVNRKPRSDRSEWADDTDYSDDWPPTIAIIDTARRLGENGCGFQRSPFYRQPSSQVQIEMPLRAALKVMLIATLALPVVECVLIGVRSLVLSMGDAAGVQMLTCLATATLAIWAVSLVGLVIVLAVFHVTEEEVAPEETEDRTK